tara:strand:+ start:423 stop:629 length:207 start_codon:yes stop_codon:yes gene_type:complete
MFKYILLLIISSGMLFPCAVCYGNPESPMSHGMNMGVLTLLIFICFVLLTIAVSILMMSFRIKKIKGK